MRRSAGARFTVNESASEFSWDNFLAGYSADMAAATKDAGANQPARR